MFDHFLSYESDDTLIKNNNKKGHLHHFKYCKVVGCASGIGLLPAALGLSFLDKGVETSPVATQVGPACAQTRPSFPGTYLRQAELFQTSCGRQT